MRLCLVSKAIAERHHSDETKSTAPTETRVLLRAVLSSGMHKLIASADLTTATLDCSTTKEKTAPSSRDVISNYPSEHSVGSV